MDDEREHARKRGPALGPQGIDGMSRLTGWVTPEMRATLDAVFAKLAAPGYANADDQRPVAWTVSRPRPRSTATCAGPAQRTHDALQRVCRAMLASGSLGRQCRRCPSPSWPPPPWPSCPRRREWAHAGGGSVLPVRTLIRMAPWALRTTYLALFDDPKKVRLYYVAAGVLPAPVNVWPCTPWIAGAVGRAVGSPAQPVPGSPCRTRLATRRQDRHRRAHPGLRL